ncbi:MAG: glycosyltransferase [Acidobacteria bacterium]|nr:glycosyltransferase [Acidobacteriota bacterium]
MSRRPSASLQSSLRIAIAHPTMGLGGAERWVLDVAAALRDRGHRVTVFTARVDRERCFEEARDGSIDIRERAGFLPANILGRLRAPCNVLRTMAVGWSLGGEPGGFDVAIADLVAHSIPLLCRRAACPVLFYCHFPDVLLTPPKRGLYRLYRRPLDRLEERGLAAADRVLVNSRFTGDRFAEAFPRLPRPGVLYPGVAVEEFADVPPPAEDGPIRLLVLGRFDPSKNLEVAIETLGELRSRLPKDLFDRLELQLAGGFDESRPEMGTLLERLRALAVRLGLAAQVSFLTNPSDAVRKALLAGCRCLLYTPPREHFGLVPVEAMAAGRPVAAVREGGPCETILDGVTGRLCAPDAASFAAAVEPWLQDPELAWTVGAAGRRRSQSFSRAGMGEALEAELRSILDP